jgi:hypothetical protein
MVSHRQDEQAFLLNCVDERVPKLLKYVLSDTRLNLLSRLRKLRDETLDSTDLSKETPPQPFASLFEVVNLI